MCNWTICQGHSLVLDSRGGGTGTYGWTELIHTRDEE